MSERIPCEEAIRLLATYLDGELGGMDERHVREHLHACRSCYSRAEFERRLKGSLAELRGEPVEPGFEKRIRTMIQGFQDVQS